MLPAEVQAVIRKPEKDRTAAEQKVADDYFPVLRIDTDKIVAILSEADRRKYRDLQAKLPRGRRPTTGRVLAGLLDRGGRPEEGDRRRATS